MGLEERMVEETIDGTIYRITPLPVGVGLKALRRTTKVIGPILSAAVKETGTAQMAAILDALPDALSDDDIDFLRNAFGSASQYKKGDNWLPMNLATQELHFAGKYPELLRWLIASMKVNFAGFTNGTANGPLVDLMSVLTTTKAA